MQMQWVWIRFSGAVGHMVAEPFVEAVLRDLKSRDCGDLVDFMLTDRGFFLDPGGCTLAGEPSEELPEIDGLRIGVMSRSAGGFATKVAGLDVRGDGYVKIHSFYQCLVCSPEQRDRIAAALAAVADRGFARSEAYFEEWKERMDARRAAEERRGG